MNTTSLAVPTAASNPIAPDPVRAPATTDASRYHAVLERAVGEGARRAAEVLATIGRDQPRDQILRGTAARFAVSAGGLGVLVGDDHYQPTDFALGQIAARAGVPCPACASSPRLRPPNGSTAWPSTSSTGIMPTPETPGSSHAACAASFAGG